MFNPLSVQKTFQSTCFFTASGSSSVRFDTPTYELVPLGDPDWALPAAVCSVACSENVFHPSLFAHRPITAYCVCVLFKIIRCSNIEADRIELFWPAEAFWRGILHRRYLQQTMKISICFSVFVIEARIIYKAAFGCHFIII